jgi:N-acetylmuramoyl-L-alanine amidase
MGKILLRAWGIGVLILVLVSYAEASFWFKGVRYWSAPDHTRVVLDVTGPGKAKTFKLYHPTRLVVDIDHVKVGYPGKRKVGDGVVKEIRWAPKGKSSRVVLVLTDDLEYSFFYLKPFRGGKARYVLDVKKPKDVVAKEKLKRVEKAIKQKREQHFIVVVDPGHGGDDPGAIHNGLMEKRVVFSIARRLVNLLNSTPGLRAYLTRKGDYFLPLKKRVEIAHDYKADLFISIHCNAAPNRRAKGVMVFALSNRGATDNVSRMLARIENTADMMEVDFSKKREINYILLDMAQDYSRLESREFARVALESLVKYTGLHRGGVKWARFAVLKNPGIPSVLVEVGFLTNRREARFLRSDLFRTRVGIALADAVEGYFKGKKKAPSPQIIMASAQKAKAQVKHPPPREVEGNGSYKKPSHSHKKWLIHVVRKGDTLWDISKKYGVKVKTIIAANGLHKSIIYPGQRLIFPVEVTSL